MTTTTACYGYCVLWLLLRAVIIYQIVPQWSSAVVCVVVTVERDVVIMVVVVVVVRFRLSVVTVVDVVVVFALLFRLVRAIFCNGVKSITHCSQ